MEAALWFRQAADKGNAQAITALSLCPQDSKPDPIPPQDSRILDAMHPVSEKSIRSINEVKLGMSFKTVTDRCERT